MWTSYPWSISDIHIFFFKMTAIKTYVCHIFFGFDSYISITLGTKIFVFFSTWIRWANYWVNHIKPCALLTKKTVIQYSRHTFFKFFMKKFGTSSWSGNFWWCLIDRSDAHIMQDAKQVHNLQRKKLLLALFIQHPWLQDYTKIK